MPNELGKTEKELIDNRVAKLQELAKLGIDPYPSISGRDHTNKAVREKQDQIIKSGEKVTVAGRIMGRRGHGKLFFYDIEDESGKIQAVLKYDNLEKDWPMIERMIDLSDFIEVFGSVFVTKTGELSVEVCGIKLLAKAVRPLPEKWHGLKDTETRYRERYVDLMVNPEVKEKFYTRSQIVQSLRTFMLNFGALEVDTPVLQPIAGGASAKPFETFYNAYNRNVYLRIAPELYLKRLLVGGFEKVFEFARSFRNEGVDATHNPEFTNFEFYWAYADYEKLMVLTEEMIRFVVESINGGNLEMEIDGHKIDFSKPFKRITFDELTKGSNTDEAFKEGVAKLIEPTFVTNHPTEMIPLAKRNRKNLDVVDTFQLVFGGVELLKAFSELNDPIDQRQRFEEQAKLRAKGDEEAQPLDEDFLKAMEYGMPPTAGWGLGIDRFVRVLTSAKTLREVLLFPFMKPALDMNNKVGKQKKTNIATVILNKASNLSNWQKMNAVAHLNASFAGRADFSLFEKDKIRTKDNHEIYLNPEHAIMIREAESNKELIEIIQKAREEGLQVFEFIRPMLETSSDKVIEQDTQGKNYNEVDFLGILVFGDKKDVDAITSKYELIK